LQLNEIGYQDWQTYVRLPYIAVAALRLDQNNRLHSKQVDAFVQYFMSLGTEMGGRLPRQWCEDVLAGLEPNLGYALALHDSELMPACAEAVALARARLEPADFRTILAGNLEVIGAMLGKRPLWWRLAGRIRRRSPRTALESVARVLTEAV